FFISNYGPLRYDIFQGSFTKNDELMASPYTDDFSFIANVTFSVANQVIPALNDDSAPAERKRDELDQDQVWVDTRYRSWLEGLGGVSGIFFSAIESRLTWKHILQSCPGAGDDTLHINLPYYDPPQYMGSNPPNVTDDTPIDLVFLTFIEDAVLGALNQLQSARNYTRADVKVYNDVLTNEMFGLYAEMNWN
ncbi:5'-nucleotidase, partial [Phlebopus sp. FC_14]